MFPITSIGLWLKNAGVKKEVMIALARLGCCPGFDAIGHRLEALEEHAKVPPVDPIK